MKLSKKLISLLLAVLMLVSCFATALTVSAEKATEESPFDFIKISNPDRGEREVDGLIDDRGTSYAWRLAKRGDDIYIATYRNLLSGVIDLFEQALAAEGISSDIVWALSDLITNGELPKAQDTDGAYIIKYNTVTGEFTKVFTFPYLMQCRMVVNYDGDIYAGSFSSVLPRQYLYKIDENDNVTQVFSTSNSFSIRANCVYDPGNGNHLYFAGADEREELDEGDETRVKVAVWEKDAEDDTVWNRVADYKDFYDYTDDEAMKNNTGCPVWELANHDGYIYAGMPYSRGFIIFRGRPAKAGETANEYGWHWEEVVGKNNGINYPGMADDPDGHDDGNFSTIVSVYEFNGDLYCFDFDQTIMAELAFIQGGLYKVAGQDVSLSDMVRPVYETLHHNQGLWKLNDETGEFELCEGFDKLMEGTTNEYVWRAQEHNGYMYVSTMDSAVIYNYITKLTNGSMITMKPEERKEMVTYINNLINLLKPIVEDAIAAKMIEALEKYKDMIEEVPEEPTEDEIAAYMAEFEALMAELDALIDQLIAEMQAEMDKELEDAFAEYEDGELDVHNDKELAGVGVMLDVSGGEDELPVTKDDIIGALSDFFTGKKESIEAKIAAVKETIASKLAELKQKLEDAYNSIDWEGMRMYLWVSERVRNDTWGFDIVRTKDGVEFEVVTDNGLGDKYNYGCPAFLSTEEGLYVGTSNPFYGGQLWLIQDKNDIPEDRVMISGTVTSFLDEEARVTVDLYNELGNNPYGCDVFGNETEYEIMNVEPGEYTLKVSKDNHVTREMTVVVGEEPLELDLKIHPIGDVNGDGLVNTTDGMRVNAHARGAALITDAYVFACGDVNNDGIVNTSDFARINAHAKNLNTLF